VVSGPHWSTGLSLGSSLPLRVDAWLSDVLGFAAYAADSADDAPPPGERSLIYAKVPVADPGSTAEFTARQFAVVDVNVTLMRRPDAGLLPDQPATVLPARPEHGAALVDIAAHCFRFSRFHLDPELPSQLADKVKAEWVRSYVEGRRGIELLAAMSDGVPVGFLAVLADGDVRAIDLVGVVPDRQGQGIGHSLVSAFIARHGDHDLRVGTQIANLPSLRLYQRSGFSLTSAAYVLHRHQHA
jgi:dTDP-4-amino-4,6-dideoxy-D-galactose acyltransferase